jgi:hypothetical protein
MCQKTFPALIFFLTHKKELSTLFNTYFVNVVKDIIQDQPGNNDSYIGDKQENLYFRKFFRFQFVNEEEVEKIITSIKNKNSCGHDEIPIKVIKHAKQNLSRILSHLINSSFVSGIFPDQLKKSKVIPIHKKNDLDTVSNFRPISILPAIAKVYEKIVNDQLLKYLESSNLLNNSQHGFRPGRSVTSAALSFIESIIESVDKGEYTIGIFMDLSKAFDSVNHNLLLQKLKVLGMTDKSIKWFQSYLENRTQYVEITQVTDNKILKVASKTEFIKYGVPQGSILGPILFLCYINDVVDSLIYTPQRNLCFYADDTNLKISASTPQQVEILSHVELENIGYYLKQHNLMLNPLKTNFVRFRTHQNKQLYEPVIIYNSQEIEIKNNIQFLGLTIDQNLNWDKHVDKVLSKLSSGLYALYRMSFFCDLKILRDIYFANIHSHLAFGICFYGSTSKFNMDRILKQQKKAIRIMMKLDYNESTKEKFKELNILTVYGQYIFDTILIAKNHKKPSSLDIHPYNTRNKKLKIQNHHNLKFYEKKPSYVGLKYFKNLPNNIKEEQNLNKFKNKLKHFLVQKSPYSLEEFFSTSSWIFY